MVTSTANSLERSQSEQKKRMNKTKSCGEIVGTPVV